MYKRAPRMNIGAFERRMTAASFDDPINMSPIKIKIDEEEEGEVEAMGP